jgi:hypothetical protein
MPHLQAIVRKRVSIESAKIQEMYDLFSKYYESCTWEVFLKDFLDKDYIIELRDSEKLCGFSTLALMESNTYPDALVIFSGDTIIDHRYWGKQVLLQTFCKFAGQLQTLNPLRKIYWFLISKGYRTYRYLNLFTYEYYPNHSTKQSFQLKEILDHFALLRFGANYQQESGLVKFAKSQGNLKPEWATINNTQQSKPEIRDFLTRNPNYHKGDELCCFVHLSETNLRSFAKQAWLRGLNTND